MTAVVSAAMTAGAILSGDPANGAEVESPCTRIARAIPASNQKQTFQCWAIAVASRLELEASRAAGKPVKLSPRYIVYAKTLSETVEAVVSGNLRPYRDTLSERTRPERVFYVQGGNLAETVDAMLRFGAMPESAYSGLPARDLKSFRAINALLTRYHEDPSAPRDRASVTASVRRVLDRHLGRPPGEFSFDGREWTAAEFREALLPQLAQTRAIELVYEPRARRERRSPSGVSGRHYVNYATARRRDVLDALAAILRARRAVLLSYVYVNEAHCGANIGFRTCGVAPALRRKLVRSAKLGHYVLALEGRFDSRGRLQRILVKNTFGTAKAYGGGFNWIEVDYLKLIDGVEIPDDVEASLIAQGLLPAAQP